MGPVIRLKTDLIYPKAIIVAEGKGGRFGGLTDQIHKGLLPVAGKTNIGQLIGQLSDFRVDHVYVATSYRSMDIKSELGYGEKIGGNFHVHYSYDKTMHNTASAARNIVFGRYKNDFKNEKYIWVLACDIGFPSADLGAFKEGFLKAVDDGGKDQYGKPKIVGGIGFVIRPYGDFMGIRPTAVINSKNLITDWIFNPIITKPAEADIIRKKITSEDVSEFEKTTKLRGLPFPTFFYILSKEAFEAISELKSRDPANLDFTANIFKLFRGRLWAYFFNERGIGGTLLRQYYDFNTPIDYYRAQWQFIRTASKAMTDSHTYFKEINSFLGFDIEGVNMKEGENNVENCVVDDHVNILDFCRLTNSIIGKNSIISNAVIKNSIILPNTFINFRPTKDKAPAVITNSIVGGGGKTPTCFDSVHSDKLEITGQLAVPDDRMHINFSYLGVEDDDVKLCEQAFVERMTTINKKKEQP